MSSIAERPAVKRKPYNPYDKSQGENFFNHSRGFLSWALTYDHKRIGIMYLVSILFFFFVAGMTAVLIRIHLLQPATDTAHLFSRDLYNQAFTIHGVLMVFLVVIPGIPAALGNIVLPLMLGAKDVAFPKLNLISYYLYLAGAAGAIGVLFTGGLDTGWTLYTPYSIESATSVTLATVVVFILGFSSIFTGLNFIVTIHRLRAPGMTWFNMPLFLWAIYATAVIQVMATPVIGITVMLLMIERTMGIGIFNPALGGDPVLYQHFFWFYSHPAVYIMILPAMGVISELISVFSHKHIFGYKFIAMSSIAIAVFSFIVWGHHMFTSGQSGLLNMVFSALTYSVSIPSAVKVFNWMATMWRGQIDYKTPMVYALSFVFIFTIGGLTGLPLAALATDIHLHDTYFVIAHFHYVMMGSAIIAFVAGLFYWWPKFTGKMYDERTGVVGAVLVFIGFNVTFFPQFMLGSKGMPRRYWTYVPEFQTYHVISTIGALILLFGFLVAGFCLIKSLISGRRASANPWGGGTLEWACASPPPHDNFSEFPHATDPYDLEPLEYDPETDGWVRRKGFARPGHDHDTPSLHGRSKH